MLIKGLFELVVFKLSLKMVTLKRKNEEFFSIVLNRHLLKKYIMALDYLKGLFLFIFSYSPFRVAVLI